MRKNIGQIARECVVDLGVTLVYATIVGLAIVAILASDHDGASLLRSVGYASLLPLGVAALILVDLGLRVLSEGVETRRRIGSLPRRL